MNTPVTLSPSNITLKNRLFKAAMAESMADSEGLPTPDYFKLYEHWGTVDNIITGHMMISPHAIAHAGDVIIQDTPQFRASMRDFCENLPRSVLVAQINHPGRQISPDLMKTGKMRPVSPIPGPVLPGWPEPEQLTDEMYAEILAMFSSSAALLLDCGFHGVNFHAAHGYLLSEVFHPDYFTQKRLDMFTEMVSKLREIYPNKILSAKMNLGDHYQLEHFKMLVDALEPYFDFVEISGGSYADPKYMSKSPRHALFAEVVEKGLNTKKIMLTGGFRSQEDFEKALTNATLVGVARPFAYEDTVLDSIIAGRTLRSSRSLPTIFLIILTIWSFFTGNNFWPIINSSAKCRDEFKAIVDGAYEREPKFSYRESYEFTKKIILPSIKKSL